MVKTEDHSEAYYGLCSHDGLHTHLLILKGKRLMGVPLVAATSNYAPLVL